MRHYRLHALSAALLSLMLTLPNTYAESPANVMFGGSQGSGSSSYTYLGAMTPIASAEPGMGPYAKVILSWLDYRYGSSERSTLSEINARGAGLELGAGYAWRYERGSIDLSATVGYRDLRVTPFAPKDQKSGSVLTLNPQIYASTPLSDKTDADLIANYAIGLGSSWARARVGAKPSGSWRAGLEAIFLDGPNYRIRQQGVFVSLPVDALTSLEFTLGRAKPQDSSASTYVGIGFARSF